MLTIHMRPMLNHTLSLILEYNNIAQPFKNKDIRYSFAHDEIAFIMAWLYNKDNPYSDDKPLL